MDAEQVFRLELFQDFRAIGCICKWGDKPGYAAIFDEEMKYRYQLFRRWHHGPTIQFCMLNASTADESKDDPTVRRCMGFAKRWGFSGIEVSNLFAWRTMDPTELTRCSDPIGRLNDSFIEATAKGCARTFVAWGALGGLLGRGKAVLELISGPVWCLGTTDGGYPRHPLYIRRDRQPIRYIRSYHP